MIKTTLQQSQPAKAPETFPALFQHTDGGVWLFENNNSAICLQKGCDLSDNVGQSLEISAVQFTRLLPDQQVVLQNLD